MINKKLTLRDSSVMAMIMNDLDNGQCVTLYSVFKFIIIFNFFKFYRFIKEICANVRVCGRLTLDLEKFGSIVPRVKFCFCAIWNSCTITRQCSVSSCHSRRDHGSSTPSFVK